MSGKHADDIAALKEATREAHEATKGLREAIRDAKKLSETLMADRIAEHINEQVVAGLDAYGKTIMKAIDAGTQAVFDRFDTLANIMTGKGKPSDMDALVKRVHAEREAIKRGGE